MQKPTIAELRVRTTSDALVIFHAVRHEMLPMVRRRLDAEERRSIRSGDVFVWEERGNAEASGLGIERWTDSIRWGPSRTRDDFLFYQEKQPRDADVITDSSASDTPYRQPLIKQTYSVYLEPCTDRRTKWHLIAYYTQNTVEQLRTIDDFPDLATLQVPDGAYRGARNPKRPARETTSLGRPLMHHHPYLHHTRNNGSPDDAANMQDDGNHGAKLAPLQYLQSIPPQRRHVVDEMTLIRLPMTINSDNFTPSHALHRHLHFSNIHNR